MLNKLVKTGHVELAEEKFRRTDAGDIALTDFDGALTQKQVAILISIDQGKAGTNAIAGFNTLLRADLIRIYGLRNFPTITLTEEGKRVLRQHADTTQAE